MPPPVVAAVVSAVVTAVVTTVITTVVEVVIEAVFGKENTDVRDEEGAMAQSTTQARALLVNKNSNNAEIPIIYGRLRTGGTRVYAETSNNSGSVANNEAGNEYFNTVIVMCEGQMGAIKQLYFDDEVVWDADQSGVTLDGSNGRYVLDTFQGSYGNLNSDGNKITYHDGRDGQTHETELTSSVGSSEWPSTSDLRGVAYLYIRLKADAEKYAGGLPLFTAVLDGKRIPDVSNTDEDDTSKTYLTTITQNQNAVDCIYDYLTNTRYGKGLDHDSNGNYVAGKDIDLDSFKTARTQAESSSHKFNGTLSTRQRIYENIQRLVSGCNGLLIYSAGKYRLIIQNANEYDANTAYQFTEENMLSNVTITKGSKTNRLNKISCGFSDKDKAYVDNIVISKSSTYLSEDNGTVLETTTDQQLVTDSSRIATLNSYKLNKSRYQTAISFRATHQSLVVEAGDVVGIKQDALGWTTPKPFRIMTSEIAGDNTIEFTAVEYESSIQI